MHSFVPQEIIRKKRLAEELSDDDIARFFGGFLEGQVADYQVSAMLMAIALNGMSRLETSSLTKLMLGSGSRFVWEGAAPVIDKHSTGGIGDKTSLIILPLCVLEGLRVPMIAGRGLGHTGGTLDKLEAIGVNVFPSQAQAKLQMEDLGGVFMGQTEEVAPLDKRLYALRDVTATVESLPLIIASILSKKLAEGLTGLVMDVKFGNGAFICAYEDSLELATGLKEVAHECGLPVRAVLSSMDAPLGRYAGNGLEVYECLQIMRGEAEKDNSTTRLSLELATEAVGLAFPKRDRQEVYETLEGHLCSGRALDLFAKLIERQGSDPAICGKPDSLLNAPCKVPVPARVGAYVGAIDVRSLGMVILELGGGRRKVGDVIDPRVGLSGLKGLGERVERGEPLAYVHAADEATAARFAEEVARAYALSDERREPVLIRDII